MSDASEHGGARRGAGRPVGSKSKRTLASEAFLGVAGAAGITPLQFGLMILRGEAITMRELDEKTGEVVEKTYLPTFADRRWAAETFASYMHPKLANIEHTGNVGIRHEDFIAKLAKEDSERIDPATVAATRRPR